MTVLEHKNVKSHGFGSLLRLTCVGATLRHCHIGSGPLNRIQHILTVTISWSNYHEAQTDDMVNPLMRHPATTAVAMARDGEWPFVQLTRVPDGSRR